MSHKIAINGFGRVGRIIYTENFSYAGQTSKSAGNCDVLNLKDLEQILKPPVTLVDIYKKVQRKYYPEKDLFCRRSK